ncbi:MAG: heavy-metal-associated domain-containing protein [Lachnospiraceae bacterium]|nr:heavy-metal-associated domain-containing protein [Lachnospiraceae bacterium]
MENIIIILILAVLLLIGIRAFIRHFRHESSCCGGGSQAAPVPEKKLDNVIGQKIVRVDGMTCDHCKGWVEKSINEIDGASARVNLKKKEAIVSMARNISDDELIAAVKRAGYRVVEIR